MSLDNGDQISVQSTTQVQQERFPSGEILLSAVQKEYDYEQARKVALETRAGILIPFAAAVLTFAVSYIKISDLKKIKIIFVTDAFLYFFYLLLALIAIASLIVSLFFLMKVFIASKYNRLSIGEFDMNYGMEKKDEVAIALASKYRDIIHHNQKVNNKKTKDYQIGVYAILISTITTILVYGISLNI
ncbi:hypothetical protein ACLZHR_09625 [Priestia aryabhattai]|uniref:hypothetical protein n=1 Tax=Priestia aryabhattai TaxID=412384 RepID=UPI003A80D2CE